MTGKNKNHDMRTGQRGLPVIVLITLLPALEGVGGVLGEGQGYSEGSVVRRVVVRRVVVRRVEVDSHPVVQGIVQDRLVRGLGHFQVLADLVLLRLAPRLVERLQLQLLLDPLLPLLLQVQGAGCRLQGAR